MNNSNEHTKEIMKSKKAKGRFCGIFFFYFFVAFEFAYMAGPFAIYFYSVYSPVLNFMNRIPALAWLVKFFLPHVVREASSPLLTVITMMGIAFSLIGFLLFVIGACQIYYSKLTKKGAVTGGLYKYIRHPQYTSFIVCSFGLLLLWPRYIVIIFFVMLLFGYYFLAKAEERECEAKFGESFLAYEQKTGRFFPRLLQGRADKSSPVKTNPLKVLAAFICTLAFFLSAAYGLNVLTIHSLYSKFEVNRATISLGKMDTNTISDILEIAERNPEVQPYLEKREFGQAELNYIMPTEWFAAEIPMNGIEYRKGHKSPRDYNRRYYKIIFLGATLSGGNGMKGSDILSKTISINPLVEVWIDIDTSSVIDIKEMPESIKYQGIPEAIY